jgi:hypothetical protein
MLFKTFIVIPCWRPDSVGNLWSLVGNILIALKTIWGAKVKLPDQFTGCNFKVFQNRQISHCFEQLPACTQTP